MKMNKILCLLLVLILVLSLGQSAFASGNATVLIEPVKEVKLLTVKEAADQLKLIASNFKQLKQDDSSFEWKYAVTDLDHDGQLELVAAAMHPEDRSTNFKVFELSEKLDHFVSCNVKLEEGESFPDILSDNADAYYNAEKDTWSYLFFDKVILSEDEVYTSKCAVTLKDEAVSYESFAFEHAERIDGVYHVTYMDPDGLPISPESYNAAGVNAFIDCEKSNVNFDWVDVDKFDQKSASDSYAIFNGEKEPEKILPVIPTLVENFVELYVPIVKIVLIQRAELRLELPQRPRQRTVQHHPQRGQRLAGYEPLGRVLHLLLQQSDRTHEHGLYQHDQRSHPVAQADDPADARAYRAAHYGPDRAAHYGPDRAAHRGADGTAHRRPRAYAGAGARTNRRSGA